MNKPKWYLGRGCPRKCPARTMMEKQLISLVNKCHQVHLNLRKYVHKKMRRQTAGSRLDRKVITKSQPESSLR